MRFEPRYLALTGLVLLIEILIATVLRHSGFIRGSLGDVLATVFVFFGILAFFRVRPVQLSLISFGIACGIELGQYFQVADRLGLRRGSLLSIVLGNSFSWGDIVCYALGSVAAFLISSRVIPERPLQTQAREEVKG